MDIRRKINICIWFLGFFLASTAFANNQNTTKNRIQGNVSDEQGEPLPGVTVLIEGTTIGTITDVEGQYVLNNVPDDARVLTFSFIGFQTLEERINSRKIINITLKEKVGELDDVVVVGYGTQKKISVLGSISNVSVKDIAKISTPSISNTLGGQIAGIVTRQSSGEPGSDQAAVYIRGFGTFENRSPLVLVDGIERDMNTINTEEIESISVLKDASATAVYGVRGANGAILITTKRGEIGKPKVTLRTESAVLTGLRYPEYINGYEYASLVNESRRNVNLGDLYLDSELQKYKDGSDPYLYPNVDWIGEIMNKHSFQNVTNLNISGGTDVVRYFVNAGFTTQTGLYKVDNLNDYNTNANVKRYNYRSRIDVNITKDISVELGVGGIIQMQNYPGASMSDIYLMLRRSNPIAVPKQLPDGSPGGTGAYGGQNPWATLTQTGYQSSSTNTVQSTFGVRWDLGSSVTEGLSLAGRFSYDHNYRGWNNRTKLYEIKQYLGTDSNGEHVYGDIIQEGSSLGYSNSNTANRAIYMEAALNYNRSFGLHNLAGMFMYNQREYVDITSGSSINNLPYRRQGLAGRMSYDFDRRYLVEVNFGYNGSEQFPKGSQFGFFPSISIGWIPSSESFWHIDAINNLKIRASHGLVGNDISSSHRRFLYLTAMEKNADGYYWGADFVQMNGFEESLIGTADVTWETSRKTNVGIDMSMLNNLINLQVDGFYEYRDGILLQRQSVPDLTGFYGSSLPFGNLGIVSNKGIETALEIKKTTASGLFYSLKGNFSFSRNKVIENDEPTPKWAYQAEKGKRVDQPFGLVAIGFFEDEDDIANSPTQTFASVVRPGDIKYKDQNGDNIIDTYDRVAIGHPRTPEIMYGLGGTLAYKGFDLSLFFVGTANASVFLDGPTMYPFVEGESTFNVLREYYDNRWVVGADNTNAKYPLAINGDSPNNYQTSTLYQKDASYLRLKNAEIGYTLPKATVRKLQMEDIRIFLNGVNLLTWDKIKIVDPEGNSGNGVGIGAYPISMTTNLGVQVTF